MNLKLNKQLYYTLVFGIWIAYFAFALYGFANVTSRSTVIYELLITTVCVELSIMSFLKNWYKKGRPTLLDWFRFTTFYVVLVNYMTLFTTLDQPIEWVYGKIYLNPNFIVPSLMVVFIGLLVMFIVEKGMIFFNPPKPPTNQKIEYLLKYSSVFYTVGVLVSVIRLYLLLSGAIGYGKESDAVTGNASFLLLIFNSLTTFYLLVLGFLKFYYKRNEKSITIFFYIFLALGLVFGLLSGMKEETITPFVTFLVPFLLGGNLIPKKVIIFGGIALMFLYPLNDNYRFALNNINGIEKKDAFLFAVAATVSGDFGSVFSEGSDKFTARLSMYPILHYTTEIEDTWTDYKHMNRYVYLPVSFMPRAFIPSKPIADTGETLNYMISGFKGNSQTPTTYGWSYLEGGFQYVALSFLLFALTISFIEIKYDATSFFSLLLYSRILIIMLKVESDIFFILAGILQEVIVFLAFYYIFIKKRIIRN